MSRATAIRCDKCGATLVEGKGDNALRDLLDTAYQLGWDCFLQIHEDKPDELIDHCPDCREA